MNWEKQIVEQYGKEYIFRQLAEEAAELCQASLKMVRAIKNETPVREDEASVHVLEEIADVEVMVNVLKLAVLNARGLEFITDTYQKKMERMIDRMLEGEPLDSNGR